jgi:hypothetical protein
MARETKQEACITVKENGDLIALAIQNGGGNMKLDVTNLAKWDDSERLLGQEVNNKIQQ